MSINILESQSYRAFVEQVTTFNQNILTSSVLSNDQLDAIYSIVKTQIEVLKQQTDESVQRGEKLRKRVFCSSNISFNNELTLLTTLTAISTLFEVGGAISLTVIKKNEAAKWVGFGVIISSIFIRSALSFYETKLAFELNEEDKQSKRNREAIENARIFKKFIKKLKVIQRYEQLLLREMNEEKKNRTIPLDFAHFAVHERLDTLIQNCLKSYVELPSDLKKDDVYCRVISTIIHKLPSTDPLRVGLEQLEPIVYITEVPSLPRFPSLPLRQSSQDSVSDEIRERGISAGVYIERAQTPPRFLQLLEDYQTQVKQRFQLTRDVSYFETPKGWKITPKSEKLEKVSSQGSDPNLESSNKAPSNDIEAQMNGSGEENQALISNEEIVKVPRNSPMNEEELTGLFMV